MTQGTIIGIVVAAIATGGLAVLTHYSFSRHTPEQPRSLQTRHVWIDEATGCEYLRSESGPFTPRLTAGGLQRGCR